MKYEDDTVCWNVPVDKVAYDLKSCIQSGRSYRLLPASVPRAVCGSRDALCKETLNDDWISHPVYVSETGFVSHKKNVYEEALYKCEEERYEFDRNIESNLYTIALLEPIAKRVMLMNAQDRSNFKLEVGLGGQSKIYQRVIVKIYDKERGQEVIDALHDHPATALPIVLKRLKQKDEEWKRAQVNLSSNHNFIVWKRDWNKVWRDLEYKNFYKSLDHQGINFKLSDRKTISGKTLLNEIELCLKEQRDRDPFFQNKHQLDYVFKDVHIFQDCFNLINRTLDNTHTNNVVEDEKIKDELVVGLLAKLFVSAGLGITMEDGEKRATYSLYANQSIYVLLRLFQVNNIMTLIYSY